MRRVSSALVALTFLFRAGPVLSHEGHGNPGLAQSVLHYVLEPEHLAVTLPTAVVIMLMGKWVSNKLLQRPALARRR